MCNLIQISSYIYKKQIVQGIPENRQQVWVMGRTVGNSLRSLFFNYGLMQWLDLRNTDFMKENITLLLGDIQISEISTYLFFILHFYIGEFHNFFERFPKICHAFPLSECVYIPARPYDRPPPKGISTPLGRDIHPYPG